MKNAEGDIKIVDIDGMTYGNDHDEAKEKMLKHAQEVKEWWKNQLEIRKGHSAQRSQA